MGLANRLILFFHSHCTLPPYTPTVCSHCMLYASHPMRHTLHFTLYALHSSRERYGKAGNCLYTLHFTLYAGTGMRKRWKKNGREKFRREDGEEKMEKNEGITISYEQTPRIYLIIGIAERCRRLYLCSIRIE